MKHSTSDISARYVRAVRRSRPDVAPYDPQVAAEDVSAGRYVPHACQSAQFWPSLRFMFSTFRRALAPMVWAVLAAIAACGGRAGNTTGSITPS